MSIHIHDLKGCSPEPLAHYLKALGILRLVAEQKDPAARGWWKDESFHLATIMDRDELEKFFLEEYAPTPIIAPWNKGSGFVLAENNPALAIIEKSKSGRLQNFRTAVSDTRQLVCELGEADSNVRKIKEETKRKGISKAEKERIKNSPEYKKRLAEADRRFKTIKAGFIPLCRRQWRGKHQEWMDAALVLTSDNEAKFPAVLGSGGNDGKNDFTKQYMESICAVMEVESGIFTPSAKDRLVASLFNVAVHDAYIDKLPVGQFMPSQAGGANMGNSPDSDSAGNPWDYILLLEGTLVLKSSVTRKTSISVANMASAPFAVHAMPTGYGSASAKEGTARGEQWMPLWEQPCTVDDLRRLMAEGRAQVGSTPASRPLDFARSVARLGVARGISAFQRFGYLERNGQSNLAVPLGRWQVVPQPNQELLDDLDRGRWLTNLQRAARDKNAPASLCAAHGLLENSIIAVCASGHEAARWQSALSDLAGIERQLVAGGKFTKEKWLQPIPSLSPGWAVAADDGSCEFRLALALAGQSANGHGADSIRRHWLPLDKFDRFATDQGGLRKDPRVVCHGLDGERDLVALVRRRIIEGEKNKGGPFPMIPVGHCAAQLSDIASFLAGAVDVNRVVGLARALMALDFKHLDRVPMTPTGDNPPPLYALFRLACLPWPLQRGGASTEISVDPAIVQRLVAGDLEGAGNLAIRRLVASGLTPVIRHIGGNDPFLARRLAASLAFPISVPTAGRLADRITKPAVNNKKGSAA